jgi:hypothetical protein
MGRRSSFKRLYKDDYATPFEAVLPLLPHLRREATRRFCEPCRGDGHLVDHLESQGLRCGFAGDIKMDWDALGMTPEWFAGIEVDGIITNPPWTRELRVALIRRFLEVCPGPIWLLMDAEFMHTRYAAPLLLQCTDIVSIGRVRWFSGTPYQSKDSACWYRFKLDDMDGTRFHGRELSMSQAMQVEEGGPR